MSKYHTAEEMKQNYIAKMGESLGELYLYLWQELVWLYSKWFEFVELFGTKPSRIDLLNRTTPYFFRIIQDALFENIVLGIARLTDPPKTVGKENLTILKIPELLDNEELKRKVNLLIEQSLDDAGFCRDWRNRRLAHLDYHFATKKETKELELASRKKIKIALESIGKVLNVISPEFEIATTIFDLPGGTSGSAYSLLSYLHYGIEYKKERRKRKLKGGERIDDFGQPDL